MILSRRKCGALKSTTQKTRSAVRPQRISAVKVQARATSVRQISSDLRAARSQLEEDEQLKVLMAGLRGSKADTSDFAGASVQMKLVEVQRSEGDTESLPLVYDPDAIALYWGRRPVSVITRLLQLFSIAGGFLGKLAWDGLRGRLQATEVARAVELRNIMTSLGPAYIKLGQALSIRPDLLSPAAMNELQKLCDKVPSFDSQLAMQVVQEELGAPWQSLFAELTPEPIAAASLGQVYKGRLRSGEVVAVKVQRPGVLETVTVDLFIIRSLGLLLRRYFPDISSRADIVALLDEWASRFFEELDYVKEGQNATRFAAQMAADLPQVVVPATFTHLTSRRVLTSEWLEGEKLSQSKANDVGTLVNVGVICFLKQLLDTGFFHADPHPGNLIRTPDGRLAILDFGLVTEVNDNIRVGMIEAISHLIHRDYEAIVKDFVTLDFIPEGTDLRPILPVLAKVFDRALEGGGAKNINFQELAADLAQITFDYPFRIPPYFALIIRAIGTLEGIALVGNPEFAIVDEAYPYIARRLLTDESPRLREALRYMVYGRTNVFDADRLIDLLIALEDFQQAASSARGDMDGPAATALATGLLPPAPSSPSLDTSLRPGSTTLARQWPPALPFPLPAPAFPLPGLLASLPFPGAAVGLSLLEASPVGRFLAQPLLSSFREAEDTSLAQGSSGYAFTGTPPDSQQSREALRFMLSPQGAWFRSFVLDELVKSVDALSREQACLLAHRLGLGGLHLPVLLPGATRSWLPVAPAISAEDRAVVDNIAKIWSFLSSQGAEQGSRQSRRGLDAAFLSDLVPVLPTLATEEVLPELTQRLASRVTARLVRELYT
ncbi:ABC1 family-domain-containing protein [Haematococcus lacustris]